MLTRLALTATSAVAAAMMVACTSTPVDPGPAASAEQPAPPAAGRAKGSLELGDLNKPKSASEVGAPFDPCGLSWSDFPAAVRPTDGKPHTPAARAIQLDDPYEVRCVYDNSGALALDTQGNNAGTSGGAFLVSVVWSANKLNADPAKRRGSTARSWNDRAGLVATYNDKKHGKACLGLVTLSRGVAGASVTNSRFRTVDPCAVVDSLLTAITATAS